MGVYRVHNTANGKSFVGSAVDLPAKMNAQRAQLEFGSHMNRALQEDWKRFGADAFRFEILEELEPLDTPGYEPAKDLKVLEEIWVEKLGAEAEKVYNGGRAPSPAPHRPPAEG
jgi:group I intron endonuclease